jgi:multiple sugar transport system substrate-binding protein
MLKKYSKLAAVTLLTSIMMSGCSSTNPTASENTVKNEPETVKPAEPINLSLFAGATLTDEQFNTFIKDPIKKKFPNITISLGRRDDKINTRESLIVTEQYPDLIYDSSTSYWNERGLNLLEPLDSYIKKYKLDTSTIVPAMQKSSKDKVSGNWDSLPISGNFSLLWINKDIFDKFGVPVPTEVQTWDQLLEINRKLVNVQDGIQYIGIQPDFHFMGNGMSLRYIDPKTNKAEVNNDQWKRILTVANNAVQVPGFFKDGKAEYARAEWLKDRNVAMVIATGIQMIGPLTEMYNNGAPMNWDMAPFPNFPEKLGVAPLNSGPKIILTNKSKHKDEAFQVMMHLLSEEVQTIISRTAQMPAIQNPKVREQFGAGIDSMKGKNVQAIFKTEPAEEIELTEVNSTVGKKIMDGFAFKIYHEQLDINTALRQADEEINKKMQSLQK